MGEDDFVESNDSIRHNRPMTASPAPTATITIRNLDGRVKERLRVRAAQNGRSMEAEVRSILSDTLAPSLAEPLNLAEAIRRRVAPLGGLELEEHPAVATQEPVSFGR